MSRAKPTRDNPRLPRLILVHPGRGLGWVSHLPDGAPMRMKRLLLEFPPFIERLRDGGKLRYNPEGLESLRRLPAPKDEAKALARWLDVDIAAQRDPAVRSFLTEWRRLFPNEQQPYMPSVVGLVVEEVPDGVSVQVVGCEGAETVVRNDGEWL
jgi:hypothetical protein